MKYRIKVTNHVGVYISDWLNQEFEEITNLIEMLSDGGKFLNFITKEGETVYFMSKILAESVVTIEKQS